MAGGVYDVSTTAMRTSGQRIYTNAQEIRAELNRLEGQLGALAGQWIGEGMTAFAGSQARYAAANAKLNAALDQISQLVLANEVQYSADDTAASTGLRATSGAMDVTVPGL